MFHPLRLPLPFRLLNAFGGALLALGMRVPALEPERLLAAARRATGHRSLGPDEAIAREGLEQLCRAAREQPRLSFLGRLITREHLLRALKNRLVLEELRRTRPELLATPLGAPLIVVGAPRSGTTHLHRLLAGLPGTRFLPTWELMEPIPSPGPDRRRAEIVTALRVINYLAPELASKHLLDPDEAEEDMLLQDPSMLSLHFFAQLPLHRYRDWWEAQPGGPSYRIWRDYLAYFQSQQPERRLVLKAPAHTSYLPDLLEVAPDALLVQTHRDPVPVIASAASLICTLHGVASTTVDPFEAASAIMEIIARVLKKSAEERDQLPPGRLVDVRYPDLIADPVGVVERICRAHGLPWDDQIRGLIAARAAERPQHKEGKHHYSLEDFGLSRAMIDEKLGWYRERFLGQG